ncbi:LTA synthase family protein [Butyrivibrio sp. XPD2002]|uniref:LTA synthase family protein n=1 Tax=Butyrivibrio sp. XPD2002 TaxID=1280665 RepID=UPI000427E8E0|nr:sulfatase-like hydrolase/transferase [Butyrivibrio sp. XPD2002]
MTGNKIFKTIYLIFAAVVTAVGLSLVTDYTGKRYIALTACFLAFAFVFPFISEKTRGMLDKWPRYVLLLIFPFVCYFLTECALDTSYSIFGSKLKAIVGNYGLYALILWSIYSFTLSLRWSVFLTGVLSGMFGVVNYYVIKFRQIPILAGDIATTGTALNVASDYEYSYTIKQFMMIAFLLACTAFLLFYRSGEEKRRDVRFRLIVAGLGVMVLCGSVYTLGATDFLRNHGISINTFMPIKSYRNNGGLLTFTRSIRTMVIDKPRNYSVDTITELQHTYSSDSVTGDSEAKRPNVIVVMDEAFADLQDVGELHTDKEVMPFYDSLTENAIKGRSYVSVFGGQTANTEYEFLSGDSKAFLPAGTTPYQLYIKSFIPTLTQNMILDNYSGILALHPYKASGYNRQNVYPYMGFSRFITIDDFSEDNHTIGGHIDDKEDFKRIIEEYEAAKAKSNEPFYIFNVTMQNHSPYEGEWENLPDEIDILDDNLQQDGVENYLNLIHESDDALRELVEYFEKTDDPTVIVYFGDHEPGLSDEFYNELLGTDKSSLKGLDQMNLYHTKFLIWANYDIPEENYNFEDGISINYVQSVMLDACGMKKSGYNKYLLDLMKDVPIINANGYVGADGKFYEVDDKTSPYYDQINVYNTLCYNHLFDKKNRVDSFFEYGE